MNSKQHEHKYVAEKVKHQKPYENYLSDSKYHTGVVEVEELVIFCIKCGHISTSKEVRDE